MVDEEEIPSGVPEDLSAMPEEKLAWVWDAPPGRGRVTFQARWRGDDLVIIAIPGLPLEQLRESCLRPAPAPAGAVARTIGERLWDFYLRLGEGRLFRATIEDPDGNVLGYVKLHHDFGLQLYDHADLLLAEWKPRPPAKGRKEA